MLVDFLVKIFGFGFKETNALRMFIDILSDVFSQGNIRKFISSFLVLLECFGTFMFGFTATPRGEPLDLAGYECVFVDEFEGDELNTDVWFHRGVGARRVGFNSAETVRVEDGNLIIKGEYLENGTYGAGWYTGAVALKEKYTRGYFEISCKCNDGPGYWSAFWLQADAPYTPEISKGGIGGAEIDIFESCNPLKGRNTVDQTIHCSGMKGDTSGGLNTQRVGSFYGKNIYTEYNTYGLMWTEDEYIFYINGIESARTSFADGVSQVPEQVIVSLEIPGEEPGEIGYEQEFIVDYVKIYQIPEAE